MDPKSLGLSSTFDGDEPDFTDGDRESRRTDDADVTRLRRLDAKDPRSHDGGADDVQGRGEDADDPMMQRPDPDVSMPLGSSSMTVEPDVLSKALDPDVLSVDPETDDPMLPLGYVDALLSSLSSFYLAFRASSVERDDEDVEADDDDVEASDDDVIEADNDFEAD
ncbi:hypothetical protein AALP_AAs67984U000200 [Arabis alpina]|uniref:Uncharacterized protein n=1 Tax=Arabis alpina TaxID=50452 RepID=A0A087FYJ8_ARAAL|nr:hypothetical protein AALP_AAs67984U000200 [Arabis alpina]